MEEILMRTKSKDSFTLVVSDTSANIQTTFSPPLHLQTNRDYELAMVNLEAYYSFANIRKGNNPLKWSIDEGKTWTLLHMPTAEITRIPGNSDITILPNVNTLQCIMTVVSASITQFNLPPSDCCCHSNFGSAAVGSRWRALGFTWREIDYTFSSS